MPFKCKRKSFQVLFRVNLNRAWNDMALLLFGHKDESLQMPFRINLNCKCQDKSFLLFLR